MRDGGRGRGERRASHWLEAMLEGRERRREGEIKAGKVAMKSSSLLHEHTSFLTNSEKSAGFNACWELRTSDTKSLN